MIVKGISTVERAVINKDDSHGYDKFNLLVEGYGLLNVMGIPGIDARSTKSNHVIEMESVLGI